MTMDWRQVSRDRPSAAVSSWRAKVDDRGGRRRAHGCVTVKSEQRWFPEIPILEFQ